jgi:hypothetical protein
MRWAVISVRLLPLVCAAAVLAACGSDEPAKPHRWSPNAAPRNEDWHSPSSSIMKYDANHDGTLTRAELEAGLKAEFNSYDIDHKGCLSSAQVTAINEARVKADAAAASPLIDWKNQGCVDLEEFSATARSLFEQLDADGDGKLTPQELHPKRRPQHGAPPPAIDEMGSGGY